MQLFPFEKFKLCRARIRNILIKFTLEKVGNWNCSFCSTARRAVLQFALSLKPKNDNTISKVQRRGAVNSKLARVGKSHSQRAFLLFCDLKYARNATNPGAGFIFLACPFRNEIEQSKFMTLASSIQHFLVPFMQFFASFRALSGDAIRHLDTRS